MSEEELSRYWQVLVDDGVATERELKLATNMMGYKEETLNAVLYARTALHDLEQYEDGKRKHEGA